MVVVTVVVCGNSCGEFVRCAKSGVTYRAADIRCTEPCGQPTTMLMRETRSAIQRRLCDCDFIFDAVSHRLIFFSFRFLLSLSLPSLFEM